MNGMTSMQKIISESGKRTIEAFVRENLAETVIFLDDVPFPTHIKEVLML